ncbi:hypothetical protein GINT2_000610 [Glugoides intestinalis]
MVIKKTTDYATFLLSLLQDKQAQFLNAFFKNDFILAKKHAFELYKSHPGYLIFFCSVKDQENQKLLISLLKKEKSVDLQLLYKLLISKEPVYDELLEFEEKYKNESFIEKCLRKAFFIRKYATLCPQNVKIELLALLDEIDDFELYDFAIKNKIQIENRSGINFSWYLLISTGCQQAGIDIIKRSTSFNDISNVLKHCSIDATGSLTHDLCIRYLTEGYSFDLLVKSFDNMKGDSLFLASKLVLALLIASKEERLLILALFLTETLDFPENYEIKLIRLFLCRYFLLFAQIEKLILQLDIKNIQVANLTYIWSDPAIVTRVKLGKMYNEFEREIKSQITVLDSTIRKFIDRKLVSNAVSSFELREKLTNCVVRSELQAFKIIATSPNTMFSEVLGNECKYIFDKITCTDIRSTSGTIHTIRSVPSVQFTKEVFVNPLMPITDQVFISNFTNSITRNTCST